MKLNEICCSFTYKLYFASNIITFIMIVIFAARFPFKDQCMQDDFHNFDLTPIYDIYLSDEKTDESIKMGELEEYTNTNIKIKSQEIYKWKNKYINVKRLNKKYKLKNMDESDYSSLSPKPLKFIEINSNPNPNSQFIKTIQIDDNNYLHFSDESKYHSGILVDLKISHSFPFTHSKEEYNICFAPYCKKTENECKPNYELIDSDSTDNFINYNNINIEIKNSYGFYKPENFSLFRIDNFYVTKEIKIKMITIYALFKALIVINITTRLIRFLFFSFLKYYPNSSNFCSYFNLIIVIIHIINFGLILPIILLMTIHLDKEEAYLTNIVPVIIHFFIFVSVEFISILTGSIPTYKNFLSEKTSNFYNFLTAIFFCIDCNKKKRQERIDKAKVSEDLEKKISEMTDEIKNKSDELCEMKLKLKKMQNANNSNEKYYNYLLKQNETEKEKINYLKYEIPKKKDILKKREEYLEKIKNNIQNKVLLDKFRKSNLKLKINCIYYDTTIDASDETSSSYEFFKYLKNSISGVFLGIKTEEDLNYALKQLENSKFKFVLIFQGNDNNKNFLEVNKEYFSHIIIFSIESSEIKELTKIKNVVSIESDYYNIILRLKEINESYKTSIELAKKYKPYKLTLFSDYLIFDNIKNCHKTLLSKTILKEDFDKINEELFDKGLDKNEIAEFIDFINSLEEVNSFEIDDFPVNDENINEEDYVEEKKNNSLNNNIKNIENEISVVKVGNIDSRDRRDNSRDNIIKKIGNEEIRVKVSNKDKRERDNNSKDNVIKIGENEDMPFKANNINTREEEGNIRENKIQIKDIEIKVYLDNDENNSEDDIKINFTNIDNENETNFINNEDDNNIERRQRAKSKNKPKKAMNSIVKSKKEFMINFLRNNDYTKNRELGLLYSLEEPKFYSYINQWLMSLNNKIYQKISPIAGKIINLIYSDIHSRNKNLKNINPKTLYRGFSIKKADIFLYKACEGDIFCYPSFTSMTSKEEVTYKFGKIDNIDNSALGNKCACIISLDYNIKNGCYVQECDFKRFSQYVKEEERLFPPFSFFKIKKVKFCSEGLHENEYFDGSEKHPFRIELEIINRNFYLDQAILMEKDFDYIKKENIWKLKEKEAITK